MTADSGSKPSHIEPADIERVMQIAGTLFAKAGFSGVGIREIALQSGVKASTIFYHFGTKEALYEEILDYQYQAVYQHVSLAIKGLADPDSKIEVIAGTLFDLLMRDRVFLMLLHRDMVDLVADRKRPALQEGYGKFFELTHSLLQASLAISVDPQVTFSLVAVIVGYSELSAALGTEKSGSRQEEASYQQRRRELVRLCRAISHIDR